MGHLYISCSCTKKKKKTFLDSFSLASLLFFLFNLFLASLSFFPRYTLNSRRRQRAICFWHFFFFWMWRICENSAFIVPLWLIIQTLALSVRSGRLSGGIFQHKARLTLCEDSGILESASFRFSSAPVRKWQLELTPEWNPLIVGPAVVLWHLCYAECQSWASKPLQPHVLRVTHSQ